MRHGTVGIVLANWRFVKFVLWKGSKSAPRRTCSSCAILFSNVQVLVGKPDFQSLACGTRITAPAHGRQVAVRGTRSIDFESLRVWLAPELSRASPHGAPPLDKIEHLCYIPTNDVLQQRNHHQTSLPSPALLGSPHPQTRSSLTCSSSATWSEPACPA